MSETEGLDANTAPTRVPAAGAGDALTPAWMQSEAQARAFEAVIHQMTDGVALADARGQLVWVNPAGRAMLGRDVPAGPPDDYAPRYQIYTLDGQPYPEAELPLARAVRGR